MRITSQVIGARVSPVKEMTDALTSPSHLLPGEALSIECWTCGKLKRVNENLYRFGKKFDLNAESERAGWLTEIDFVRQRRLTFCSENCLNQAKKKDGTFKKTRPR